MLVDSACTLHNVIRLGRLFHILTIIVKKLRRSCTIFCNLKSLPLVVRVGDVVKFRIATKSYLPDKPSSLSYKFQTSPLIRR